MTGRVGFVTEVARAEIRIGKAEPRSGYCSCRGWRELGRGWAGAQSKVWNAGLVNEWLTIDTERGMVGTVVVGSALVEQRTGLGRAGSPMVKTEEAAGHRRGH